MHLTSPDVEIPQEEFEDLRSKFINKYGVSIEIPAYYHYDSKFVPHDPEYVVTMGFHVIQSKTSDHEILTTYVDGDREEVSTFDEIFQKQGQNLIISLNKVDGRNGF